MRIVIDLQGAQGTSRFRGIGRYSLSLAQAMVRNKGEHEIILTLNGLFPETIEPIRAAFDGLLPQDNIRVWYAPNLGSCSESIYSWRKKNAELVREAFLASLQPDVVYVTSLFEGFVDDAVTSIGLFTSNIPTAVTLYDLIPLINRAQYLNNPVFELWYEGKIDLLGQADLLLAISESSRQEGIKYLDFPPDRLINVSTAADPQFECVKISAAMENSVRKRYGLSRQFVMYTGGIDYRKNIEGLIRAYALLPKSLRENHQLAIVCSVQPESRHLLETLAKQQGLATDEVILTGFVPEDDLIVLYQLCKAFVFPSWHEGFGLPALEAMSCGAAVIAANTSSSPEVIGREDALFDPFDDKAIAEKITQLLVDDAYRSELICHGSMQAKKFSWDESAKSTIAAFEQLHATKSKPQQQVSLPIHRPKLAYISPLPPERSGISDYSVELLPELARHYDIEVIVAQDVISDPWIKANCPIRTAKWFKTHADLYDRVLYHFGNSDFHQHMFDLLAQIPGVIVLHDFYLSGIVAHMDVNGFKPDAWAYELYHAHGYKAVQERFQAKDTADIVYKYPCNLTVVEDALNVIVHSENSRQLAKQWIGASFVDDWAVIPLLRTPATIISLHQHQQTRTELNVPKDAFLVCSFGMIGPTKQNHRLLDAWIASSLSKDPDCFLVFVGENHGGDYGAALLQAIQDNGLENRIRITGWTDITQFRQYLAAADVGVQLRALSRGETSAAVLDCMNYGVPTIVNANGSMADLPADAVWILSDEFDDADLIRALEMLWKDEEKRNALGARAREVILTQHAPSTCADQYAQVIEHYYAQAQNGQDGLIKAIAKIEDTPSKDAEWVQLAHAISLNQPPIAQRQLLVDISELVQGDAKSGVQRVVRSILIELLSNPPIGYRVEPVYIAAHEPGYRYARQFTLRFLGCPDQVLVDEPIDYSHQDIFLALDLNLPLTAVVQDCYVRLKRHGVKLYVIVYDILLVQHPEWWPEGAGAMFEAWLRGISDVATGLICISEAVAAEVRAWHKFNPPQQLSGPTVSSFHLGADVENSLPSRGMSNGAQAVLGVLKTKPSFLMVGTIEPRKGHAQTLTAFEHLWAQGIDANLVIVGKQGWLVDQLVDKLSQHPELNQRVFWLEGISDEYLGKVYAASACLIAASEGEGFGLPLIEAARHKLPIIARDIPVFREVAGEYAYYFNGHDPQSLADSVKSWLVLNVVSKAPQSGGMQWLTWKDSVAQLKELLLVDHSQKEYALKGYL
jgi:glycosyltransferase involved in cell wall biosynthesis